MILRQKGAVYQHEASYGYSPELHAHMSKVRFEPGSRGERRRFERGLDHSSARFDPDGALGGQSLVADEMHEAARAVAALLDLATIGVEYPVAKIDVGASRLFHEQNLVAADTEVPVGNAPDLRRCERDVFAHAIEHDKIVAKPLHFREP